MDKMFVGVMSIEHLTKDLVYCEEVRLVFVKDKKIVLNNKG